MRLVDYLDKGASLGPEAACLTTDGETLSYAEVRQLSFRIAAGLAASGVRPGGKVAILSANDPIAFACVFGISRAGAIWCPINPRNEAAENRELLDQFDCEVLIYQAAFAPLVNRIRDSLPKVHTFVCLDGDPQDSGPDPHPSGRSVGGRKVCVTPCRGISSRNAWMSGARMITISPPDVRTGKHSTPAACVSGASAR